MPNSFTHLRSTFSWTPRSRPACASDTPRSLTSYTASTLNSRLNFRLCMTHLRLYETPNLGVHQTGNSSDSVHSTPPLNTSALTPIAGLDWLDIAADAKPADIFRAIGNLRKEAREEIDRLIRFLDETENHMCVDDEGGGDAEPDNPR